MGSWHTPTLAQFQSLVRAGRIHYFVAGTRGFGGGSGSGAIASWVEESFTSASIGGMTVYDLGS
jgi:hypothetical protein